MAHQLEMAADGSASFAFDGKIGSAWHKLGVEMPGPSTTQEILAACKGDYTVHRDKLYAKNPLGEGPDLDTGKSITWREKVLEDEDGVPTGVEQQVLGVVGDDYPTYQNEELLELARRIAGFAPDEAFVDCAGVLYEGRRFFATIPLPEIVIDPNGINDRYGRNLVVATSHDAKRSIEGANSITRGVCANTVEYVLNQKLFRFSIRHDSRMRDSVTETQAKRALGLALSANEEFELIAHNLLKIKSNWGEVERIAARVWPLPEGANDRTKTNHEVRMTKLHSIWDSPRAAQNYGANRYSAFHTFSEYMEHHQHIVGESNSYNRAVRAVDSGGIAKRIHRLGEVLQMKSPVKGLAAGI